MTRTPTRSLPLLVLLLGSVGCPHEGKQQQVPDDPLAIVRQYLRASVSGDMSGVRDLVQKRCFKTGVGRGEATIMFGARIKLEQLQVELEDRQSDTAIVRYKVTGSHEGVDLMKLKKPVTEINILGQRVEARPPVNTIKGMSRKGSLDLVREGGRWKLTCKK